MHAVARPTIDISTSRAMRRATTTTPSSSPTTSTAPPISLASVRVVVWDVDGTLADSTSLGFDSTNQVLRSRGLPTIDRDEYLLGTKYTTPRRLAWHATKDADHECGRELGDAFDALYVELVSRETCGFYPGIMDVVRRLKSRGTRQAVLSNACGAYARRVIAANGVEDVMEACYGADDVSRAKPAPDGVIKIMHELRVDDGETLAYIGDAPSDGAAALAAGCLAIGVNWGSHDLRSAENAANFHVVYDSPDELEAALFM